MFENYNSKSRSWYEITYYQMSCYVWSLVYAISIDPMNDASSSTSDRSTWSKFDHDKRTDQDWYDMCCTSSLPSKDRFGPIYLEYSSFTIENITFKKKEKMHSGWWGSRETQSVCYVYDIIIFPVGFSFVLYPFQYYEALQKSQMRYRLFKEVLTINFISTNICPDARWIKGWYLL